ncbi:MAG: UDP-2,3-diacylglucosamine diphosphatase LpxI [Deltaproteobacteria bacterium]|nr:UDP-2,3-diacylglucosamine diphosphatase LpxI [Deltaproteobacteria bacterium]
MKPGNPVSGAIGIIAGNGELPAMVASGARSQGLRVVVAGLKGEVDGSLRALSDHYREVPIGNFGAIVRTFLDNGASCAVMVGGVSKRRLFSRVRPDRLAAKLLLRLPHYKDDHALRAVADLLGEEGITVVDASAFVPEALAPEGVLSKRQPSDGERADIEFGFKVLRELSPVDVGQTVVVRSGVILAIEAIEGTDACIRRGAELGRGRSVITRGGAVVCKAVKRGQDRRFDLPAAGLGTIDVCREVGVKILAIEAGGTLLIGRDAMIKAANRGRISVVGVSVKGKA